MTYILDLVPTIYRLTGTEIPAGIDGSDLAPLWRGEKKAVRDSLFLAFQDKMRSVRDQRWKLRVYPVLKTVHIDRIAREGASFNNFFVGTPLCSPSRASFLTRLYPHRHRAFNNDKLGLDIVSHMLMAFPRQLRETVVKQRWSASGAWA